VVSKATQCSGLVASVGAQALVAVHKISEHLPALIVKVVVAPDTVASGLQISPVAHAVA